MNAMNPFEEYELRTIRAQARELWAQRARLLSMRNRVLRLFAGQHATLNVLQSFQMHLREVGLKMAGINPNVVDEVPWDQWPEPLQLSCPALEIFGRHLIVFGQDSEIVFGSDQEWALRVWSARHYSEIEHTNAVSVVRVRFAVISRGESVEAQPEWYLPENLRDRLTQKRLDAWGVGMIAHT